MKLPSHNHYDLLPSVGRNLAFRGIFAIFASVSRRHSLLCVYSSFSKTWIFMKKFYKLLFFVSSDAAMKQFLLFLDETMALGQKFIIQDSDERHLFISADIIETLEAKLDDLMDQIGCPVEIWKFEMISVLWKWLLNVFGQCIRKLWRDSILYSIHGDQMMDAPWMCFVHNYINYFEVMVHLELHILK